MLNSAAAYLEVNQTSHLMVICCDCSVTIWNIQQQSVEMTGSVASLLTGTVTIESTQVNDSGQCIISMSSGESFTYHPTMKTWARIADKSFTTSLFNSIVEANRISPRGLLSRLQVAAQKKIRMLPTEMLHLDSRDQSAETVAHLEVRRITSQVVDTDCHRI
jgi:protein HIRA/HIR1